MFNKFVFKLKKGEEPGFRELKKFILAILHFNVPAWKIIYIPLGKFHSFVTVNFRFFLQKLYYEPIFKTKCTSCGKRLCIDIRMPQISDNISLTIGNGVTLNGVNSFFAPAIYEKPEIIIGDHSGLGFQVSISAAQKVEIGKYCLIAARVAIMDNNNHPLDPEERMAGGKVSVKEIAPVVIEDNVWIGYQSYINKGVRIGEGAIVGANSVVRKDVPPFSIVLGNPARVVGWLKKEH